MTFEEQCEKSFANWGTSQSIYAVRQYDSVNSYMTGERLFKHKKDAYKFAHQCLENSVDVQVEHLFLKTETKWK